MDVGGKRVSGWVHLSVNDLVVLGFFFFYSAMARVADRRNSDDQDEQNGQRNPDDVVFLVARGSASVEGIGTLFELPIAYVLIGTTLCRKVVDVDSRLLVDVPRSRVVVCELHVVVLKEVLTQNGVVFRVVSLDKDVTTMWIGS